MKVKFCRDCGRLGFAIFSYCPWCGAQFAQRPDPEEVIGRAAERLGRARATGMGARIDLLERSLLDIERDLDDFLAADCPIDAGFGEGGKR